MATSLGRVYLNGCNYELAYDLLGQNVEGNYSNVRLYGILHVTNKYISWSRGSASVHTSGLQGIGTYYSRGDYTVITRDFTFGHDNNGNFSTWIGASLSTTFVSGDTGGTLTLPSIPRYTSITRFDVTAKDETSLSVNWAAADNCDYLWYSLNNGSWTSAGGSPFTISGLTANTKYDVKIRVRRTDSQLTTDSWTVSQTTYDYPHAISVDKNPLVIGDKQTVTLYNPLKRSIQVHLISGTVDRYTSAENTTGTTSSPFNSSEWIDWFYARIPNAQQGTYQIKVVCSSPSHTSTTTESYTFKIKGTETPTFSNFEFEDTNTTTLALTGNNQYNVNGYSNIKATISTTNKATAKKSATMRKYRFAIGSNSVDINYSSSQEVSGTINKAPNGTYNVYAIDSRNNSTLVTKLASKVIPYENIYINPNESIIERNDNRVGDNAILTLKGTFWNDSFGSVTNTIKSVTYRLRKTDSSTWINGETTITPTISGNNFTFTGEIASDNQDTSWDLDSSYYIEVTITDELSTSIKGFTLNSAIPTMSLDKNGVGIMCAYDSNLGGKLQVGGNPVDIDNYSTSETLTNKIWIDGKPIYRKCFLQNNINHFNANISDVDNFITIKSLFKNVTTNEWREIPWLYSESDNYGPASWAGGVFVTQDGNVYFQVGSNLGNVNKVIVILEYTKTTD